jgi:glycerate 2-kinase
MRSPRQAALAILNAALAAADPYKAVLRHVRRRGDVLIAGRYRYRLDSFANIYVIGAGKAGAPMARAVERLLGHRIHSGLINVKYRHAAKLRRVELNECGHPVPDENGVRGSRRIAEIAAAAGPDDLVICLISGGASALLPLPAAPVTLADKQETTRLLLACGADIHELNCVRKHISAIKGGKLARVASPARVLTLVLSDVIGDDLDTIGSGPTVPDRSTFADARAILKHYGLLGKVPRAVRNRIEEGQDDAWSFNHVRNIVVGSNRLAVDAAAARARSLGYRTLVLSTFLEGETRDVARVHAAIAREIVATGRPVRPPACVISGGETTVTLRGHGLGGRNQEFALAAALDIAGLEDVLILSAGTDGTDGPTDAAGAVATGITVARAHALGLDAAAYLAANDSYHFFEPLGDLIKTGPTGTNVMDIHLVLVTA